MKNNHSFPLVALVILAGVVIAFAGPSGPSHPVVGTSPAPAAAPAASPTE